MQAVTTNAFYTKSEVAQPLLFLFAFAVTFFYRHLHFLVRFFGLIFIFIFILIFHSVFISIFICVCIFVLPAFAFQSAFHVYQHFQLRFRFCLHLHFAFNSYFFVTSKSKRRVKRHYISTFYFVSFITHLLFM